MAKEFNFSNNYDSVYGVDLVPPKRTGAKVALISAAVLGVAAGGGAAAYNFSPFVKNQVKMRVSSPENYSSWVYTENTETLAKQVADQYRAYIDKLNTGSTVDVTFKFEPSDEALELAKGSLGEKELEDVILDTTDIFISMSAASKAGDSSGAVRIGRNGDTLTTLEYALEENPFDLFLRVPELSEKWLNADKESLDGELEKADRMRPEEIISPEELEAEVKRYTDLWNKYTGDVTVEKKEDVAIEDITVNYTVITRTLTPDQIEEMSNAILEEMKNDELLRTIIVDRLKAAESVDEYNEMIDKAIEEGNPVTETVQLDTYVDPKGTIRGFRGLKGEEVEVDFVYGISGDQVRGKFVSDEFNGTLTATQSGNKYTGNLKYNVDDQAFTIDFIDYEQTSKDFGFFSADTVVRYADDDEEKMAVSIKFTGTSESETAVMDIKDSEGTNYGKFTVGITSKTGAEVSIPDKSSACYIDSDFDYTDYVTNDEIKAYTDSLLDKLGVSEKVAEDIGGLLGGGGSYYDDFDYDDFEYDDDDFDFDDLDLEDIEDETEPEVTEADVSIEDLFADRPSLDELADDLVTVGSRQAWIYVSDQDAHGNVPTSIGDERVRIAKGAVMADVNGPGTYVCSVSSDNDSYRRVAAKDKTDGINMMWLAIDGVPEIGDDNIDVTKVTIDGKDVTSKCVELYEGYNGSIIVYLYLSFKSGADHTLCKEWNNIEVTFDIK